MMFDPPAALSAAALAGLGLDVERAAVVNTRARVVPGSDSLWALEQALKSGHVGAVVAWLPPRLRAERLRRLQLAAHSHDGAAFVMREVPSPARPTASPLRLALQAGGADRLAAAQRPEAARAAARSAAAARAADRALDGGAAALGRASERPPRCPRPPSSISPDAVATASHLAEPCLRRLLDSLPDPTRALGRAPSAFSRSNRSQPPCVEAARGTVPSRDRPGRRASHLGRQRGGAERRASSRG